MNKFFIPFDENFQNPPQWDDYTLILPCVSVGNVPQLCLDLLINQFIRHPDSKEQDSINDLEMVGYIFSKHVCPFAGPDSFKLGGSLLSTSIQVFASKSKKIIIIQQRSPIYKEFRNEFYMELIEWLSTFKFSLILLLSSSFNHYLAPEFVDNLAYPIMYLSENIDDSLKSFISEKLEIKPVFKVDPYSMKPSENGKIHLPGSGGVRSFLKHLSKSDKDNGNVTKILCLIMFCSEGDNRFHSFRYADKIADILNRSTQIIKPQEKVPAVHQSDDNCEQYQEHYSWKFPFSWRMLYGDEPPAELY